MIYIFLYLHKSITTPAQAQVTEKYFYTVGSIGYSDLAVDDPATDYPPVFFSYLADIPASRSDSYDVDEKETDWGIYGCYQINQNFGIEAGYTDSGQGELNQNSTYIFSESESGAISTKPLLTEFPLDCAFITLQL